MNTRWSVLRLCLGITLTAFAPGCSQQPVNPPQRTPSAFVRGSEFDRGISAAAEQEGVKFTNYGGGSSTNASGDGKSDKDIEGTFDGMPDQAQRFLRTLRGEIVKRAKQSGVVVEEAALPAGDVPTAEWSLRYAEGNQEGEVKATLSEDGKSFGSDPTLRRYTVRVLLREVPRSSK